MIRLLRPLTLALACAACGSAPPPQPLHAGDKAEPRSDTERDVLGQLDGWPAGQAKTVGGVKVVAEPPYVAASGSTCRWLQLEGQKGAERRLACQDREGTPWFYAPSVLTETPRPE